MLKYNFLKSHFIILGILFILYLFMIFIANPAGEFPVNDECIYAKIVLYIFQHHSYYVPDICSPVLIMQILWGTLFCLPGGFSFTTLRISTIVLGLAGVFIFYFLLYDFSKNRRISFLAALLLMVNPLFFCLANSFMTDVPFLTMALFAIFFFVKYINNPQYKLLIWATLFSIFASLIRQFGVIIPVAFGICEAILQKKDLLIRIKYFIPAILSVAMLEIALLWLKYLGSSPVIDTLSSSFLDVFSNYEFWTYEFFYRSQNVLFYSGLSFFPLLLFLKLPSFKGINLFLLIILIALLTILSFAFIYFYNQFPDMKFPGNYILNNAIGPRTLDDNTNDSSGFFSSFTLKIVYTLGDAGAILLLIHFTGLFLKFIKHVKKPLVFISAFSSKKIFIALCTAGYLFMFLMPLEHYDRYMLPLFTLICLLILTGIRNKLFINLPAVLFSIVFIFLLAIYSTHGTHDYFSWNRARWQAVDFLTKERNISIHDIDGGYEVNVWLAGMGRHPDIHKKWASVESDEYMISSGKIEGCRTMKKFNYQNYNPLGIRSIFALHTDFGCYDRGMYFYQLKDFVKAIVALDSAIAINPKQYLAYNTLGVYFHNYRHDDDSAKEYFEKAIKINPDYTPSYINLLACAQTENDEQSFIKYIRILFNKGMSISDIKAKGINVPDEVLQKINAG